MSATVYKVEMVLADGERKSFLNEKVNNHMDGINPEDVLIRRRYSADGAINTDAKLEQLTDELLLEYFELSDISEAYQRRDYILECKKERALNSASPSHVLKLV